MSGAHPDATPPLPRRPCPPGFGRTEWRTIGVAALALVPFVAVRFFGVGRGPSLGMAAGIGVAIVAAAFFLTWATEALEVVIAAAVALAILALVEVAPEYAFEILLAYRQQVSLAAASMTGANRLLFGLGWPLILLLAFWGARRRGQRVTEPRLDARHSVLGNLRTVHIVRRLRRRDGASGEAPT